MTLNRKLMMAAISLLVISLTVGILLGGLIGQEDEINLFTYPLSVGDKTFIVTVETSWNEERAPLVALLNSSDNQYPLELYFRGGTEEKTISYKISIPTELLSGDISLIWKYYLQEPDRYTLINNGTYSSLEMIFDYQPFFSGAGYFVILGTEGAW